MIRVNAYHKVGKEWTKVAHLIKHIPRTGYANSKAAKDLLVKIGIDEERILNSLSEVKIRASALYSLLSFSYHSALTKYDNKCPKYSF